eukprot:IDg2375t1
MLRERLECCRTSGTLSLIRLDSCQSNEEGGHQDSVILHNMMVEDLDGLQMEEEEEVDSTFINVGNGSNAMWAGLERLPGSLIPLLGSIAALCETRAYFHDTA